MNASIWDDLIEKYGTQTRLADVCEVSAPSVYERRRKASPVPAEWARRIHDDCGYPLHAMRPDLWPEAVAS